MKKVTLKLVNERKILEVTTKSKKILKLMLKKHVNKIFPKKSKEKKKQIGFKKED